MPLESDIDALFRLPAAEFTAARNTLASKLKKASRGADADQVKALAKPSLSAWAVNQLYWRHRKAFDKLLSAGERFKKAQAAQLSGESVDLRGPLSAHRDALTELTKLAATLLDSEGHAASPNTVRRITTTLEAIAAYGSNPEAPKPGRLTDDIDPPGFEALAALVPQNGGRQREGGAPKVIPFRQSRPPRQGRKKTETPEEEERRRAEEHKALVTAARAAMDEADRALTAGRKRAQQAEAALKTAAAKAKELERERAALEKTFEKAAAAADEAQKEARRFAGEAEEAAQSLDDAERAVEKARQELEALE